jgi:hypothetical protein
MQKPPPVAFSSQNAFAALDTKKSKKKKATKDKDEKAKKDKGKSGDAPNGFGSSATGAGSADQGFGGTTTVDWADDSDDEFDMPVAAWMQVRTLSGSPGLS